MENTCTVPKEVDFSRLTYHSVYNNDWFQHLSLLFTLVLLCRAVWYFDCASRLHRVIRLLITMVTTSGRAKRTRRQQLVEQVNQMQANLNGLSMKKHFVAYSKLERRIKEARRQLEKMSTDAMPGKIVQAGSIRAFLFILEIVLQSWLVRRSPSELVSNADLFEPPVEGCPPPPSSLAREALQYLLLFLCYLPTKLYTFLAILICRQWLSARLLHLMARVMRVGEEAAVKPDYTDPAVAFSSTAD